MSGAADWISLLDAATWTPPEQRSEELAAEAHLLALDCVGLASFARLCEVEEQRIALDAELELPRPEPGFRITLGIDADGWARSVLDCRGSRIVVIGAQRHGRSSAAAEFREWYERQLQI